ncbi:MAG: 1-deoxy-D-xylulose-5-phosphate reductoisomerase [Candidatus Carbobacillus altaicus]|nr:1-deoxy-D-xylulose-5-phosphate reductoisomerase [Candidatus Carbobacillus altaicus]
MTGVAILGSTGSIGEQTLSVIDAHPDRFNVISLVAGRRVERLAKQIIRYRPRCVSVQDDVARDILLAIAEEDPVLKGALEGVEIAVGEEGAVACATAPGVERVMSALVGFAGVAPTLQAIRSGIDVALANKEVLVAAGEIVMKEVAYRGVRLLPVDSEHAALFQVLLNTPREEVERVVLTASGGALRDKSRDDLKHVRVQDALKHPNWKMGNKLTIDSATMMNKGLEVIEAHWLFSLPFDAIDVMLHDESIVHCMVELIDGHFMAEMAPVDMRLPIQYALTYPERVRFAPKRLNWLEIHKLSFRPVDFNRYPALKLAYEAGRLGRSYPAVLNAANEVAVRLVLSEKIPFFAIEPIVENVLSRHQVCQLDSLETIREVDQWARRAAEEEAQKWAGSFENRM